MHAHRFGRCRHIVETGLKRPPAPHAWAIAANGSLHSVHVPIRPDGSIETGGATRQTEIALYDLRATLEAAGASFEDEVLVHIYLKPLEHKPAVDTVCKLFLTDPYLVWACIAVSGLPTPGK